MHFNNILITKKEIKLSWWMVELDLILLKTFSKFVVINEWCFKKANTTKFERKSSVNYKTQWRLNGFMTSGRKNSNYFAKGKNKW